MKCEICGEGQIQKAENDYVCSRCGAFYSKEYIRKMSSLTHGGNAELQESQKYVSPQYDSFQRRLVLFYSQKGSGIEAYENWKRMTPYNPHPNNDEISKRVTLLKAAEMEKACNPWMEMEPIARCEKEALEYGCGYVAYYRKDKYNEKDVLAALQNGKISINSVYKEYADASCRELTAQHYLIITAISKNHVELVHYLLEHYCDISVEAFSTTNGLKNYETPLFSAVSVQNMDIFDELVKRGCDVHQRIKTGAFEINLLNYAATACSPETVLHLLASGIDPNELSYYTYQSVPLYQALLCGRYDNAKVLIDGGADVNFVINSFEADYTMLNWAVVTGNADAFNLLISSHANPNCIRVTHPDGVKIPALFDAVWRKNHDMVKRLVFAGADVNCFQEKKDGSKLSLIDQARANLDTDIIPFLISHGAA